MKFRQTLPLNFLKCTQYALQRGSESRHEVLYIQRGSESYVFDSAIGTVGVGWVDLLPAPAAETRWIFHMALLMRSMGDLDVAVYFLSQSHVDKCGRRAVRHHRKVVGQR